MGEHGVKPDGTFDKKRQKQIECEDRCIAEALGLESLIGSGLVLGGEPSIGKPFAQKGAAKGTSPLSKGLSKIPVLSKPLPRDIPTPIRGHLKATSNIPGRILGRWLPWVGTGMLAIDYYQILECTAKCLECEE
jgi:hypothetical protein